MRLKEYLNENFMSDAEITKILKRAIPGTKLVFTGHTPQMAEKELTFYKVKDTDVSTILSRQKNLKINKGIKVIGLAYKHKEGKIRKLNPSGARPNTYTLAVDSVRTSI
jgi:hypothetical protein